MGWGDGGPKTGREDGGRAEKGGRRTRTATRWPRRTRCMPRASISVDLPTPGDPDKPMRMDLKDDAGNDGGRTMAARGHWRHADIGGARTMACGTAMTRGVGEMEPDVSEPLSGRVEGPRTMDRLQRTTDRGPRTKDQGQTTDDRGPWTQGVALAVLVSVPPPHAALLAFRLRLGSSVPVPALVRGRTQGVALADLVSVPSPHAALLAFRLRPCSTCSRLYRRPRLLSVSLVPRPLPSSTTLSQPRPVFPLRLMRASQRVRRRVQPLRHRAHQRPRLRAVLRQRRLHCESTRNPPRIQHESMPNPE